MKSWIESNSDIPASIYTSKTLRDVKPKGASGVIQHTFFTTNNVVKSTQKSYRSKSKHVVLKCYLGEKRLHDAAISGRP